MDVNNRTGYNQAVRSVRGMVDILLRIQDKDGNVLLEQRGDDEVSLV